MLQTPHSTCLLKPYSNTHTLIHLHAEKNNWKMKLTVPTGVSNAPTYLAWSILNTIFCCTPLGIIAIVFSCRTDSANLIGDAARANAHSSLAKKLNIAALVIGIIFFIISIIITSLYLQT